jgi:hypothetical protein
MKDNNNAHVNPRDMVPFIEFQGLTPVTLITLSYAQALATFTASQILNLDETLTR